MHFQLIAISAFLATALGLPFPPAGGLMNISPATNFDLSNPVSCVGIANCNGGPGKPSSGSSASPLAQGAMGGNKLVHRSGTWLGTAKSGSGENMDRKT